MELLQTLRNRDRLVRTILTAGLAVFALSSLQNGKRLRGVLAGLGALGLGYSVWSDADDSGVVTGELLDTDPTNEAEQLRCVACGEPIVAGQSRRPNENNETVHEACLEAPA
jgi:hypothetical protein